MPSTTNTTTSTIVLLLIALLPPLGLSFFLLPTRFAATGRARQGLFDGAILWVLGYSIPYLSLIATSYDLIFGVTAAVLWGLSWIAFFTVAVWMLRKEVVRTRGMKCWGCGRKGEITTPYCGMCGVEEPMMVGRKDEEGLRCGGCGKERVTTRFCPECGVPGPVGRGAEVREAGRMKEG